jgi:hypothetical protein
MFIILKQFILGNDQIWVTKLNKNDPEYIYSIEQEAIDKASELQTNDPDKRQYKVVSYNQQ